MRVLACLLVCLFLAACSDPSCRPGEIQIGMTCYAKKQDAGDDEPTARDAGLDASLTRDASKIETEGREDASDATADATTDAMTPEDAMTPPGCESVKCGEHELCSAKAGAPTCECEVGFTREGSACVDIDECALSTAGCHPSAGCENKAGGYDCTCPPGFSGGGSSGIACGSRLALGNSFACGVNADRKVECWGENNFGQLGDGTTVTRQTAAPVSGLQNVAMVDAGANFACALLYDGTVRCWGGNDNLQCGADVVTNKQLPVAVSGLTDAVAIAVSRDIFDPKYACAIRKNRSVVCWGNDNAGYLGDGMITDGSRFQPMPVGGIDNALSVSLAGANCTTGSDGSLRCWGKGSAWNYGSTAVSPFTQPFTNAIKADMGPFVACVLLSSGSVACWGNPGLQGASSPSTDSYAFTQLGGRSVALSVGLYNSCAVRDSGALMCWGAGTTPALFEGTMNAVAVSNYSERMCALLKDGKVFCRDLGSTPAKAIPTPDVDLF